MTVVWVFLGPLLVVVGVAALAAALVVVVMFGAALFGRPFAAASRRLLLWRALRDERRDLNAGRWALLERRPDVLERYREIVTFGPVERVAPRSWRVALQGEHEVCLSHRGRKRVVRCGSEELSVQDWLRRLEAELAARTTTSIAERVVDDMDALNAAIRDANAFLTPPLTAPASASYRDIMAAVGSRTTLLPVDEPEKPVLEARFAEFCEARGYRPPPDRLRELFPELNEARSWLAGSRLPQAAGDEDESEDEGPLQLYVAGTRWVLLRFSFEDPWIVGDYPHPAAYVFDVAVRPALTEYERDSRLADPLLLLR